MKLINIFSAGLVVSYGGGAVSYATSPYYDILIRCTDGTNTIYSNIVVDIVKNEPPTIDNLPSNSLIFSLLCDKLSNSIHFI